MNFSKLAVIAGALALSGNALADHQDNRWHITPMGGYIWADDDRGTDFDGAVGQINIGNAINEKVDLDFRIQYLDLGETQEQVGAGIEATWFKSRTAKVTPLFTLGAGWLANDITGNNNADDSIVLDAGLGLQATLNDHGLALRGDIRHRLDFSDNATDDFGDTIALLGLVVPLGDKPQAQAAAPADSDGDGVADGADLCPNTAKGTKVDANGCAQTQAADDTKLVVVYFDLESAELSEAAKAELETISAQMVERKYIVAVATGYTDTTGTADYNLALSRKRANSVKAYLIERGVRTANVIAKGVGEADPAVSNETRTGREQNRRVEVRLLDQ